MEKRGPMPDEFCEEPNLPKFQDRLPDLISCLRQCGGELAKANNKQSYIPYWEDVYAIAHNLKGVTRILPTPPEMVKFIERFTDILHSALAGDRVCRENKQSGTIFQKMASLLDSDGNIGFSSLQELCSELEKLLTVDKNHEERLAEIPSHLFYVNEFVSKKSREIKILDLHSCVVEDEILLEEIPFWRTQLNEALIHQEFGRGILVNFLPFLSSEGSKNLKVWAWVAAASHSRASLKQRLKEIMPKVKLGKI